MCSSDLLAERHTTIGHFEGGDYGDFPASYRFGQHQVVGTTTFTTLDGSRSIELRYGGPLIRRNAAFLGTVDPVLSYTGTLTATDIYHGAFISTASGEGTVLNLSGTTTYAHTSVYVDGVRVSRSDVFVSFTGANVDHLCEYLLGA